MESESITSYMQYVGYNPAMSEIFYEHGKMHESRKIAPPL